MCYIFVTCLIFAVPVFTLIFALGRLLTNWLCEYISFVCTYNIFTTIALGLLVIIAFVVLIGLIGLLILLILGCIRKGISGTFDARLCWFENGHEKYCCYNDDEKLLWFLWCCGYYKNRTFCCCGCECDECEMGMFPAPQVYPPCERVSHKTHIYIPIDNSLQIQNDI